MSNLAPWTPTPGPGWQLRRFRTVGSTASGSGFPLSLQGNPDLELPFYKVKHLGQSTSAGSLAAADDSIERETAASLGATIFPEGTLVYAKVGAALMLGRVRTLPQPACIDNNMAGLVPNPGVDARFLFWAMTQIKFDYLVNPGAVPSLSDRNLLDFPLLVPTTDQQRAIADYLDRETARIDALIEEQKRLIELLQERRDSVWSSGLESAYGCGVVVPIKRVLASIVDGPFGSSLTSAHYSDEGTRVIRLGNIGMCEFRDSSAAYISTTYAEELNEHAVNAGDVVIAGLGDDRMPLGRATVVPPDIGPAIVKADCYRARPTSAVTPSYLAWALTAPQTRSQIMLLARGATRARLNTSVVQQVEIPLPSTDVQAALVREWAERNAVIDTLIVETERFIELSRERRAALITAAVTGQIDLRAAA